jgi:uncharacterized protein (DUF934 family)
MAKVIKNRRVIEDTWQRLPADATDIPPTGDLIVPIALWRGRREGLSREGRLGVWLDGASDPAELKADFARLEVIAFHIPKSGDGRAYSNGRLLRERDGWKGEMRAFGDIWRDHLLMLERCGFDAFVVRDSENPEEALAAFAEHADQYQASASQPLPLFRRRTA